MHHIYVKKESVRVCVCVCVCVGSSLAFVRKGGGLGVHDPSDATARQGRYGLLPGTQVLNIVVPGLQVIHIYIYMYMYIYIHIYIYNGEQLCTRTVAKCTGSCLGF